MPVVPVLPSDASAANLQLWPMWQKGRICAANVTWSADASDAGAQQNKILSTLTVAKGYNAIRLVLSAGSSTLGWFDMAMIAQQGWSDSATLLQTSQQPISEVADNIDKILLQCSKLGLGVILDCHDFFQRDQDDGTTGELWEGSNAANLRQYLQDFWVKTVNRWGPVAWAAATWNTHDEGAGPEKYPYPIIGYELLNEPNPKPTLTFAQMQASEDNNWKTLADKCIKAIRQIDADTPIIIDGIYYADAYGLAYFSDSNVGLLDDYQSNGTTPKALADRRIIYSFHVYGPYDFTHQGVIEGTYESLGLPYPFPTGAVLKTAVYDGTSISGTSKTLYFAHATKADLVARIQPALTFKNYLNTTTAAAPAPIFVGEFSAVNPALLKSEQVPGKDDVANGVTASAHRAITQISVAADGWATVTLGKLPSGFNVNFFPFGSGQGAYNDYAVAKIESASNSSYNLDYVQVRIENGSAQIRKQTNVAGTVVGFKYPSQLATLGGGSTQVATLTLKPYASAAVVDAARVQYIKDVLSICIENKLSWAYWAEDAYVGAPDSLGAGVFVGWRPSTAISSVLTKAAARRTVV